MQFEQQPPDTIDNQPTRQAVAVVGRSGKLTVSGKLKVALDYMIWDGDKRIDAATKAGLTDHGVRTALSKPHVKAYYNAQLEVLRTNERARNIHALASVRDGTNQMARVAAVKALEQLSDETTARSGASPGVPGMTIRIMQVVGAPGQPAEAMQGVQIDATSHNPSD